MIREWQRGRKSREEKEGGWKSRWNTERCIPGEEAPLLGRDIGLLLW